MACFFSKGRGTADLFGAFQKKWAGRELNPRHRDFQSLALPTELPAREGCLLGGRHYSSLSQLHKLLGADRLRFYEMCDRY